MRGDGLAMMSGTLTAGILVGYVFVVPGLGTVAIAGLLNVPLGTMLIFGFSAEAGTPILLTILLAWLIAAVLHLAIGSISVAAITAAGILAPIMDRLEVPALVMALAIGSGALFAVLLRRSSTIGVWLRRRYTPVPTAVTPNPNGSGVALIVGSGALS